jgi:UDP-N-acetyl-D-glucosamine dehydrogenase
MSKAVIKDMRESPTFVLMDKLSDRGAEVAYYDPHGPEIGPTREHKRWQGMRSIAWEERALGTFDAAIIATAHKVDTRNLFGANFPGICVGRCDECSEHDRPVPITAAPLL